MHAKGTFEVKVAPAEPTEFEKQHGLARFTLDKVWHGDFAGISQGEMLTRSEASTGSMAYVALEQMSGKLAGKSGTFTFTHQASMLKSAPKSGVMQITVVPHSGTGELTGLTGTLTIVIDATGKHSWEFDYTLP